jgi:hypothetical protein
MSDFVLNESQLQQFTILNEVFDKVQPKLSNMLTVDSLVNELTFINSIESRIPESVRLDLHLSMIFDKGKRSVSDYYKALSGGTNYILEAARKVFPDSIEITESIESFKTYLISRLNEEMMALAEPTGFITSSGLEKAFSGGEIAARASGSFWTMLKGLLNAVTEGGSTIGIIQFIIDIIGFVGDFIFPGVGVVADLINAIIYFIRGEWLLGAISIIAALVVGGGDTLKLLKGGASTASPIFVKLAKGQVDNAADAVAKLSTKESGPVMKLLRTLVSYIGGAIGSGTTLLGKFIKNFSKVTNFIPGLGKKLKNLFDFLGSSITNFGTKMITFCDSFKLMEKSLATTAIKNMDLAAKEGSTVFKLSDDGRLLYAINKEGKTISRIPSELFVQSEIATIKYGPKGARKLFTTAADFATYHKGITSLATRPSFISGFTKYFTKTIPSAVKTSVKELPFFIGKQIYKIATGKPWVDGEGGGGNAWSKEEVEGHGSAAFREFIDGQIAKKKAETGATYVPYVTLDSSDEETYNKVIDYQNSLAKRTGDPSIMKLITKNYDSEKVNDEFDEFFNNIASGKVEHGETGDVVAHSDTQSKESNEPASNDGNFVRATQPEFKPRTVDQFSKFNEKP